MRFHNYFKVSSYLLVFSAFLSLALTEDLEPPYAIVMILAVIGGLVQGRFDLSTLSRGILIVSVPFLIADFFFISRDILYAFTHLLILLTAARFIFIRTDRDYRQLYLLTFFDLLASSALTVNLSFALTFALYLVSAAWVMLLFHIKREAEGKVPGGERALEAAVTAPFFIGMGGVALASLVFTLAIFFILPRMGVGLFYKRPAKVLKTSGFGDRVDFGEIGPVTLDPTTVMRVELPDMEKGMGSIYLRGTAFDYFDGVNWGRRKTGFTALKREGNDFLVSPSDNPLLRQEIILDPIDSRVIFGMPRLARLSGRFPALFADDYGAVYLSATPFSKFHYTAYSDPLVPKGEELDRDRGMYPPDILGTFTKIPPLSERVKEFSSSITRGAESPYQKAAAIDGYLKRNYSYTLEPGRDESLPPVEDFLFKNREGYCDHFSTAMAVLLRMEGIPARLVTGYVTSEWNDLGRFYTVRQSNAHSWVEVYFPSYGWIPFDPTPLSPPRKENILADTVSRYIGYVRLKWDRYIINFTLQDQVNAAREVRRRSEVGREALLRIMSSLKGKAKELWMPAVLAAAVIVFLYFLLLKRWKGIGRAVFKEKGTVPFYQEMLRILSREGILKPEGMTPREFARHVIREKGEPYSGIIEVTSAFEKIRYGGASASSMDMERINRILEGLKGK